MVTKNDIEQDLCGVAQHDAAIWYAGLKRRDTDESVWLAFAEWLERDPAHRLAYEEVERLNEALDQVRDQVLDRAGTSEVLQLRARRRRFWLAAGAAAALAASLLVILLPRGAAPVPRLYETRDGETRTETLADGTVVEVNRGTAMTVTLSDRQRDIRLDHGEALFHVAIDPKRPLVVVAGGREIRDIGTVFDVMRSADQVVVGVVQGRVAVAPPGGGVPAVLAAGDRLAAKDGEPATVSHGDPAAVSSWTQGFLIYENAPFSKVVGDLNRYGRLTIVQQGPDSGFAPISGILEISDQAVMLDRLGHMIPLAVDRSQEGRILVRAEAGKQ